MLTIIHKNLFDDTHCAIVHGCNCFNNMGAGFARVIRREYPEAAQVDSETNYGDYAKMGTFTYYEYMERREIIINLYTQYHLGGNRNNFEFDKFKEGYLKMIDFLKSKKYEYVALPLIGGGLAAHTEDARLENANNMKGFLEEVEFDNRLYLI